MKRFEAAGWAVALAFIVYKAGWTQGARRMQRTMLRKDDTALETFRDTLRDLGVWPDKPAPAATGMMSAEEFAKAFAPTHSKPERPERNARPKSDGGYA